MAIISGAVKEYSRTPGHRNVIDEIVSSVLFSQCIFGQQILDPNWSWLRYARVQILYISLVIYVIFGTIEVLKTATDILLQLEGFYTFITISVYPIKFLLFAINRSDFRQVYLITKTTLLDFIKEVSEEKGANLLKKVQLIVRLLIATILLPVMLYVLTAMCSTYIFGKRVTLSKTTSTLMPMTSPFYEIGLILHMIFLVHIAFTIIVIDMWFIYLMTFFCTSSDCLVDVLCVSREVGDTDDTYATKLNAALKKFYLAHVQQMRYLNIIVKMYKWPSVIPLCHVLICICSQLFVLSTEFSWAFLSFVSNLLPTCGDLFAYNWYGEQVKNKAINLNMALMNFDWPSMRLKDKKNYYIIITYMQKQFGIKTAFGSYLSLLTISSVLKASYQAFAVLKTMDH